MWPGRRLYESNSSSVDALTSVGKIKLIKSNTTTTDRVELNMESSAARMDSEIFFELNLDKDPETYHEQNQPIYENLKPGLLSGQTMLLKKLFRSIEKPEVIYENLCRGCGYGVFEANSYLCNFCSCVVGGLKNSRFPHLEESNQIFVNTGENIYENICIKCSALYTGEECEFCLANVKTTATNIHEISKSTVTTGKNDHIKKEIRASKSFSKFDKQKLINGFFGSLKRGLKTKQATSIGKDRGSKKLCQLDIIHHVDGHNNIFRTNETFDLQRICEMKKAKKLYSEISSSDQHIYGRLKLNESVDSNTATKYTSFVSKSQELLQVSQIDSMCTASTNDGNLGSSIQKNISKLQVNLFSTQDNKKLALPLSNSICYWMKLLRKQIHNYQSYDDGDFALCIPKSIPSKNVLMNTYYAAKTNTNNCSVKALPFYLAEIMTNFPVIDKKGEFNYTSTCTTLTNTTNPHTDSSGNIVGEQMENCFDVMVDVFKQNLFTKHLLDHQRESQPSVDHSNSLSAEPSGNHLTRSTKQRANYQTKCMNDENNASAIVCPPEHSPILVMNSPQPPLSIVGSEKCLASCCSACNEAKGNNKRCGCFNIGDDGSRIADSEFQHQTVASVEKYQNKETKTLIKTETTDSYNSAAASDSHEEHVKRIICISNVTDNIENISYLPNKVYAKFNLVCLANSVSISYSLNTYVLQSCSNRSQFFNWLQDWLLCYFNPWSLNAKRYLKVLANCDNFEIAFKLWTVLYESVTRYKSMWKDDKQGKIICIGEAAISRPNAQVVMKYTHSRMSLQSEPENVAVFDEKESEKLNLSRSAVTTKPMKTDEEVVLRTKSKESLERNRKARGKFLDFEENVVDVNETTLELNCDGSQENIEVEFRSSDVKASSTNVLPTNFGPRNDKSFPENDAQRKEEDIYQPIWKFKTVGEAQEHYDSDPEFCDSNKRRRSLVEKKHLISDESPIQSILISDDVEDHGEWETDDEFMFSKMSDACYVAEDELSSHTSHSTISQASFDSSSTDITSSKNLNFEHPILRTVCILYSLSEPKIRAIIYDYNRAKASQYFSKYATLPPIKPSWKASSNVHITNLPYTTRKDPSSSSATFKASESDRTLAAVNSKPVQAWKLDLLNAAYVEDEEDLLVSETKILQSQVFKEEPEILINPPKLNTLQRFKSASFDTLLDIPTEDDKKSITERMRNKLQRGVFKLNMLSPKSEKKRNGIFRSVKTGSLYLEEGIQPKFPIFGASLGELEMNESIHENVPRFVVDCVTYIERHDSILQDGLYRASGNKVAIDDLKRKLSESYIYDSKMLVADDTHTITGLLKLFFRELSKPLIPQHIYDQIGRNVPEAAGIELLRDTLDDIPDPNRSTLKFLIRHLKNVAAFSTENRMPAKNLAIVWGPCIFSSNQMIFVDIGRMNTLTKLFIEHYEYIFKENERLVN